MTTKTKTPKDPTGAERQRRYKAKRKAQQLAVTPAAANAVTPWPVTPLWSAFRRAWR
jgi:hypothetical protein